MRKHELTGISWRTRIRGRKGGVVPGYNHLCRKPLHHRAGGAPQLSHRAEASPWEEAGELNRQFHPVPTGTTKAPALSHRQDDRPEGTRERVLLRGIPFARYPPVGPP